MSDFNAIDLIASGKTKEVWTTNQKGVALFLSKDDLTAGDGAKHDVVIGKASLANQTTCNVFRFLNSCGIPTSFIKQVDETSFIGQLCDMIPYEVVVRREAYGSYLKAYPYLPKGHIFQRLVVQFFLKTSGKTWLDKAIPVDDPLAFFGEDGVMHLFRPDQPIDGQEPFLSTTDYSLRYAPEIMGNIAEIAAKTFLALEKAWQQVGGNRRLIDFKVEFGINSDDKLVLADVIDSDSWRVLDREGKHLDKQLYRNGANTDVVLEKYQIAADLTGLFTVPLQQIIIWSGSPKDDISVIENAIADYTSNGRQVITKVACSMHKQPVEGINIVNYHIRNIPDSVIIAYIGMSNGAGPTLSANVCVPVISVPAGYEKSPNDVFSSLNTPSFVPTETIVSPKNAALAALKILSMRNPKIYMDLRYQQEKLLTNYLIL
jgi:phosphoribosylaminoimidazole carboxylase/phosphoribosylaminoimidazole-succinocarboxamide synthase